MNLDFVRTYRRYPPNTMADAERMDDAREFYHILEYLTRRWTGSLLNATIMKTSISKDGYVFSSTTGVDPEQDRPESSSNYHALVKVDILDMQKREVPMDLQSFVDQGDVEQLEEYTVSTTIQGAAAWRYLTEAGLDPNLAHNIQGAIKKMEIDQPSPILTFYLNRYRHVSNNAQPRFEQEVQFDYPETLAVAGQEYLLHSVIRFQGAHYNVYCRSANELEWIHINNHLVRPSSITEALSHRGNAYMLFYTQADLIRPGPEEPVIPEALQRRIEVFEAMESAQYALVGGINRIIYALGEFRKFQLSGGGQYELNEKAIEDAGKNYAHLNFYHSSFSDPAISNTANKSNNVVESEAKPVGKGAVMVSDQGNLTQFVTETSLTDGKDDDLILEFGEMLHSFQK